MLRSWASFWRPRSVARCNAYYVCFRSLNALDQLSTARTVSHKAAFRRHSGHIKLRINQALMHFGWKRCLHGN